MAILAIHFILAGAGYLELWRANDEHYDIPLSNWKFLLPIWVLFMFVFDSLPPIYLIHRMAEEDKDARKEESILPSYIRIYTQHKSITGLVLGQLLNTFIYIIFAFLTGYSQFCSNDRNMTSTMCIFCLLDIVHSVLVTLLAREMKIIISEIEEFGGARRKNMRKLSCIFKRNDNNSSVGISKPIGNVMASERTLATIRMSLKAKLQL